MTALIVRERETVAQMKRRPTRQVGQRVKVRMARQHRSERRNRDLRERRTLELGEGTGLERRVLLRGGRSGTV